MYLVIKPELLSEVVQFIETGEKVDNDILDINISEHEELGTSTRRIKSSSSARDSFADEVEQKFKKKGKSAT